MFKATRLSKDFNKEIINEKCNWTIASINDVEYRYFNLYLNDLSCNPEINGTALVLNQITVKNIRLIFTTLSFHSVYSFKKEYHSLDGVYFEFIGDYFTENLEIWFNNLKLKSVYRSSQKISSLKPSNIVLDNVEILFIQDNIVFNMGFLNNFDILISTN